MVTPFIVASVSTYFGYSFSQEDKDDPVAKLESAKALGKSMTLITIVPGICCFCVYSILHCTYERDVKRVQLLTNDAKASGSDVSDDKDHAESAQLPTNDAETSGCEITDGTCPEGTGSQ